MISEEKSGYGMSTEEMKEITLEKFRYGIKKIIPDIYLQDLAINVDYDNFIMETVCRIKYSLLGNKIHSETIEHIEYPKNWWEAIKEAFLPLWLKQYFPVKHNVEDKIINIIHICPHINFATNNQPHFSFLTPTEGLNDRKI